MLNLKAHLLGGWIGDRLLRDVTVGSCEDLGPSFRQISVSAPWLRQTPVGAGDKVQVFVPSVGARTYTPFDYDATVGRFSLLAYLHGDTPGANWARSLDVGATVRIIGPRSSIPLATLTGPIALFGDETSLALARSLHALEAAREASHGDSNARSIGRLEVSSVEAVATAWADLRLPPDTLVARETGDVHLSRIASDLLAATSAGGTIVLSGRARSIQGIRAVLRAAPTDISPSRRQVVRAYWADGKRGLD